MPERRTRFGITHQEIYAGRDSPKGSPTPAGWSRAKLASWGVPFPPPAFWIERLVADGFPYRRPEDGSDEVEESPYQDAVTRRNRAYERGRMAQAMADLKKKAKGQ